MVAKDVGELDIISAASSVGGLVVAPTSVPRQFAAAVVQELPPQWSKEPYAGATSIG